MTLKFLWSCLVVLQLISITWSQCTSDTPIDYLFVVDTSSTIGSTNFGIVRSWIQTLVTTYISTDSRVGFVTFDDTATTSAISSGTGSSWSSTAGSLTYTGGDDRDLAAALDAAVSAFNTAGTTRQRQMIIFMDGQPSTFLCDSYSEAIKEANINSFIVGTTAKFVGSLVDCILYDYSGDILELPSYSTSKISNIASNMTDMLCPSDYQLRITEVKVQSSQRFVEIYNYGKSIAISDLELTYLFLGSISSSQNLTYGQYLVIYDGDETTPSCSSCSCTTTSNLCNDAIYYGCTSGGSCWYDGDTFGYSSTSWRLLIEDTNTNNQLIDLTYGASDNWIVVPSGFSYELKSNGYDSSKGYNWRQSCDSNGSPGDDIYDCGTSCTVSYCQLNGASGATCDTSICSCNQVRYTRTDSTCRRLAPPSNCVGYVYKQYWRGDDYTTAPNIYFVWDPSDMDENVQYKIFTYTLTGTSQTLTARGRSYRTSSFYFDGVPSLSNAGIVAAYDTSTQSYSENVTCPIVTLSPSTSPTMAPTYSPTSGPTQGPTKAPTFEDPKVWITGDICEADRCDCNGAGYTSCTGSEIRREFIASDEAQFITVRRYPGNYIKNVTVYWRLIYFGQSDVDGNVTDSRRRLQDTDTTMMPSTTEFEEGITPSQGNITVVGDNDARISLLIRLYTQIDGTPYRLYKLQLYECETNNASCYTVYPSNLTMVVDISGGESTSTSSREKEIPQWLWWVVGAIILFLFILAWFVYKFWFAKRQTDKQIADTEEDLDYALKENELGFGHEVGDDNIGFNPLNTSAPKGYKAPDLNLNPQPNSDPDNFDSIAKTDIERFNVKQEFGPQMGNAPRNQEDEPLL